MSKVIKVKVEHEATAVQVTKVELLKAFADATAFHTKGLISVGMKEKEALTYTAFNAMVVSDVLDKLFGDEDDALGVVDLLKALYELTSDGEEETDPNDKKGE